VLLATERLMISIGECVSAFGKSVLKIKFRLGQEFVRD
jgi:hypothetical protein